MRHPIAQHLDLQLRGHAQTVQGPGHAVFKQMLQFVHAASGLLAKVGGHVAQAFGGFLQPFLGFILAFALECQTIVDQGFDRFAALLLGSGHGAQSGQPNMLGRWWGAALRRG